MLDVNQDDDDISLRPDTLACLQEFLAEKAERERQESAVINCGKIDKIEDVPFKTFEEDWQLSQFWYNEGTKETLSKICEKLLNGAGKMQIALLSCPSLYEAIRKVNADGDVTLFEYDRRFSCYGADFVFYDYNNVSNDPEYMHDHLHQFDIVIMDPPFLAEECIVKLAQIVNKISKPNAKLILCSGEVVEDWASKYIGLTKCNFRPEHERNLGNTFASYANFEMDDLIT